MLLLGDISAIKETINICLNPTVKGEVLCAHGSVYKEKAELWEHDVVCKELWERNLKEKAAIIRESSNLLKDLEEENLLFLVSRIGLMMLNWAEYHEKILGLTREYTVKCFNISFFTEEGLIDKEKVAKILMKDHSLNIKQRYALACVYCFTDDIHELFKEMTDKDKKTFYDAENPERIKQAEIVKLWTYYHKNEIDKLTNDELHVYQLKTAVESGNKTAVEYFMKTIANKTDNITIEVALEAMRLWELSRMRDWDVSSFLTRIAEKTYIPEEYCAEVASCLLSAMEESEKILTLKEDIEDDQDKIHYKNKRYSRVLECLLCWPFEDYFMRIAELTWEFLPEWNFAALLLLICDEIETDGLYGEGKTYYRRILKEFWSQSDDHFKRYVFKNESVDYSNGRRTESFVGILTRLLNLTKFIDEDRENFELILENATEKERELITTSSEDLKRFCIAVICNAHWKILNIILKLFSTEEDIAKFKKELKTAFADDLQRAFINFMKNDEWNTVETFLKWMSLSEEELFLFKENSIYSKWGIEACFSLISDDEKTETAEKVIRKCLSDEDKVKLFKEKLIFSCDGIRKLEVLMIECKLQVANKIVGFCVSSEEEIKKIKKKVAYDVGGSVFVDLILPAYAKYFKHRKTVHDNLLHISCQPVRAGKWEEFENFINWSFTSKEEMRDFIRNKILKEFGSHLKSHLLRSNEWTEADKFFKWLELSTEEIKELKEETFSSNGEA